MKKIIGILQSAEKWFLVICLGMMGIILAMQVVLRYVFKSPVSWSEECARYLQIWITFVGIGYGVRKGSHISMNLLRDRMPRGLKYLSMLICDLAVLAANGALLWVSPEFLAQQNKLSSAMRIPMKLVYLAIPVGFAIYTVYIIVGMYRYSSDFFEGKGTD